MSPLTIVSDAADRGDRLCRRLAAVFDVQRIDLHEIERARPGRRTLFDVDLSEPSRLIAIRKWIQSKPRDGKAIFITDKGSRIQTIRAHAIGATDIVHRPVEPLALLHALNGNFAALATAMDLPAGTAQGVVAAHDGLQDIFSVATLGKPLDQESIGAAGEAVINEIASQGLAAWIDSVRKHHSQTYQHCLLVTGVTVSFAQHLGLSQSDRKRLSFAAMLHDIGKACIPVSILEKKAPLDANERAVINQHPQHGVDALLTAEGLHPEMIDMVLHHHEHLDGSGYPHGLKGAEISDLVRVITIADVFSALIEKRAYKPPLSNDDAYQILVDMGPKLDTSLVRAFRSVCHGRDHRLHG
jgi:putative nucleotidyltransferase with HDIG domain